MDQVFPSIVLIRRVVLLQIFHHHPLFGFRVHITPQDEAPEHCVARQDFGYIAFR